MRSHQRPRGRSVSPHPEILEDRMLLYATTGNLWHYASRVTYSFVPDGTVVASGTPSTLNQAFNSEGIATSSWQQQFEEAFGLWEQIAGINIARVSDNGAPLATSGNQQDDPRFGDIRISGMPLSPGTLALTFLPPPSNGGTLAGDIIFNTNEPWQVGSNYDIETVALHEIGHALGLDHSSLQSAVMYAYYNGVKPVPTTDDALGLQAIYGGIQPDLFNTGGSSDHSPSTAANLNPWVNNAGWVIAPNMDLYGQNVSEWYYVTAPANSSGNVTVTVQSAGLSSLSPAFSIYNSSLQYISGSYTPAAYTYGGVASKTFAGAAPGTGFYIQVSGTGSYGDISNGLYALEVNFGATVLPLLAPPSTVVAQQADRGGGSELELVDQAVAQLASGNTGDIDVGQGDQTATADALTVGEVRRLGPSAARAHRIAERLMAAQARIDHKAAEKAPASLNHAVKHPLATVHTRATARRR